MESPMFTDEEEAETPRTHIQKFLDNVTTDPRYSLSSKRNRRAHSFTKTPEKKVKAKEKRSLLRLSTSLPSPGSLITPKTNLQHLLLGSGPANTPYDRRVASTRSSRSSTNHKSLLLHQAPSDWGQKVSLSPVYNTSPSRHSNGFDEGSPSKLFKRTQHHRSFRIPDPPANSTRNSRFGDQVVSSGDDALVIDTDVDPEDSDERRGNQSPITAQIDSPQASPSKQPLHGLQQINKSLLQEKAKKAYELQTSSADEEDSFNDSNFLLNSKSRQMSLRKSSSNLSFRKSTPSKTNKSLIASESNSSVRRSLRKNLNVSEINRSERQSPRKSLIAAETNSSERRSPRKHLNASEINNSKPGRMSPDWGSPTKSMIASETNTSKSQREYTGNNSKTDQSQSNLSLRKSTPVKINANSSRGKITDDSVTEVSKQIFDGPAPSSSKKINNAASRSIGSRSFVVDRDVSVHRDNASDLGNNYDDDGDVSEFHSLSQSKKSADVYALNESGSLNQSLTRDTNTSLRKSSHPETPEKVQSAPSAIVTPRGKTPSIVEGGLNPLQNSDEELPDVSMSTSYSDEATNSRIEINSKGKVSHGVHSSARSRSDSHLNSTNADTSKMKKVSQPTTPIKIHSLSRTSPERQSPRKSLMASESDSSVRRSPRKNLNVSEINRSERQSPRKSLIAAETNSSERRSPRKHLNAPEINNSKSGRMSPDWGSPTKSMIASETNTSKSQRLSTGNNSKTDQSRSRRVSSSGKRLATNDIEVDIEDQFSGIEGALNPSQSHSNKRRKTNSLNDLLNETNPSSSTPFKRSKSFFNSTKVQASMSSYLVASKESDSRDNKSVAIGDLSPIRPYGVQGPDMMSSDNEDPLNSVRENTLQKSKSKSQMASTSWHKDRVDDQQASGEEGEEEEEELVQYTPMKTPVIDMNKLPLPLTGKMSRGRHNVNTAEAATKGKQPVAARKSKPTSAASGKRKSGSKSSSIIPKKTVKFMAELYSSMKIDKEALEELETLTQQFMVNTIEAAECYSLHAGRKTITEADFVLMMKKQRLIKTKEDLYDLIRKFLPMEQRCELIPCFPTHR